MAREFRADVAGPRMPTAGHAGGICESFHVEHSRGEVQSAFAELAALQSGAKPSVEAALASLEEQRLQHGHAEEELWAHLQAHECRQRDMQGEVQSAFAELAALQSGAKPSVEAALASLEEQRLQHGHAEEELWAHLQAHECRQRDMQGEVQSAFAELAALQSGAKPSVEAALSATAKSDEMEAKVQFFEQVGRASEELQKGFAELRMSFGEVSEADQRPSQQIQSEQLAQTEASLVALRGTLSLELAEVKRMLAEEMASQARDFSEQLAQGRTTTVVEIETVRGQLIETVEDSIDLRRQLLELCRSHMQPRAEGEPITASSFLVSEAQQHLPTEGADWAAQLKTLWSRCEGLAEEVRRVADRQTAAEQSTSRGLTTMQQAVEGLSIRLGEVSAPRDSAIFGQRLFVNQANLGSEPEPFRKMQQKRKTPRCSCPAMKGCWKWNWKRDVNVAMARGMPPGQVHFYTFSDTIPHPGLCVLAEAASELGGVLRVMGLSKRPGYILIHSHSPTLKFLMLQEVLEYEVSKRRIASDDLVIFADGHDVLLQQPLADIVAAYSRWPGSPYLISGERNCWPWPHTDPSHGAWDLTDRASFGNVSWTVNRWIKFAPQDFCRMIRADGPYPFPNIGLSMGPVSRVIEVLRRNNKIVLEEDVNDQGAMWLVIMRHALELNIQIDQHAEVFMSMLQYKAGELEREPCGHGWFRGPGARGTPKNVLTNTTPGLLHFNGPSHEDDVWPTCFHTMNTQSWARHNPLLATSKS
ncbi:unnamed protein product [Symbiodinium sp. CCMP2592]|nr:unnamed protein product [Symbiodinium sp. CCMP2592]